jgi:molybdopterin/thiamine biosynthesis adenylyltransferase
MDIIKHISVFNPQLVGGRVAVIGVGALGSALSLQLAKLGLTLDLFDHDKIEGHNIANQVLYGDADLGENKVDRAADLLVQLTGLSHQGHPEKVCTKNQIRGYTAVFVCVDSMEQRTAITRLLFCSGVKLLIEGRMGARGGAAYCLDAEDPVQMTEYQAELYQDSDVVVDRAACGTIQSVVSTASMAASWMAWLFIQHVMEDPNRVNEIMFGVSPPILTSRRFNTSSSI